MFGISRRCTNFAARNGASEIADFSTEAALSKSVILRRRAHPPHLAEVAALA
jgi:hypothetical protein